MERHKQETAYCLDFVEFITSDADAYVRNPEHPEKKYTALFLDLCGTHINSSRVPLLCSSLKEKNLPPDLQMILWDNGMGSRGVKHLAHYLKGPNVPPILYINLGRNFINKRGARYLAESLPYMRDNFELELCSNAIQDEGAKYFADALNQAPKHFGLNLTDNGITDVGASNLANAVPGSAEGLYLNLSNNSISDEGALAFANAMTQAPEQFKLSLYNNTLSERGLMSLIDSLQYAPDGVYLDIGHNNLKESLFDSLTAFITNPLKYLQEYRSGDAIVMRLAELLEAPNGIRAKNLNIALKHLQISDIGAIALLRAIRRGNTPPGLTLELDGNDIDTSCLKKIEKALKKNEEIRIAQSCLNFHLGTLDAQHSISKLPPEILCRIYHYLDEQNCIPNHIPFTNKVFTFFNKQMAARQGKTDEAEAMEPNGKKRRLNV